MICAVTLGDGNQIIQMATINFVKVSNKDSVNKKIYNWHHQTF